MVDTAALGAAGPKAMRRIALPSSVLAPCGALVPACSSLQPAHPSVLGLWYCQGMSQDPSHLCSLQPAALMY